MIRSLLIACVCLVTLTGAGCNATTPEDSDAEAPYTEEEINYFMEVALGSEYGGASATIKKWTSDLRIRVSGSPTEDDRATLNQVISELNALLQPIELRLVDESPAIEMYFVPPEDFSQYEPNYVPGNLGFFYAYWNADCEIGRATILISTDDLTQPRRSHLIREELTQTLGLMRDAGRYSDSIFYDEPTTATAYSAIDETVIEMLYRPELTPCMGAEDVRDTLETLDA